MEYSSLSEMTRQEYTDRHDRYEKENPVEQIRLIFQKYDEANTKFLGYCEDLEELNKQQEHDIYYS